MTNDNCPHRYGCDDYRYGHCDGCNLAKIVPIDTSVMITDVKTNADLFKQIFGVYATEVWSMSESQFLEWLNEEVRK